jgi:hypothetical protein
MRQAISPRFAMRILVNTYSAQPGLRLSRKAAMPY